MIQYIITCYKQLIYFNQYFCQSQFAYDIPMPIGTNLVAVQSGKVVGDVENFEDVQDGVNDISLIDKANYISIEHPD